MRDFQWISGGLWSSIWKAREPKDPKNLQGLKLKRKTHPIDIHKPPGWVQHPSEDNDAGGARREIRKSHQIQDCCRKNLAGLLLSHTHCVWKQTSYCPELSVQENHSLLCIYKDILDPWPFVTFTCGNVYIIISRLENISFIFLNDVDDGFLWTF